MGVFMHDDDTLLYAYILESSGWVYRHGFASGQVDKPVLGEFLLG